MHHAPPSDRRLGAGIVRLIALGLALLGVAPRAHAWGRIGHRAAAKLAEARLTPEARAAIRDLLDVGESLADASTWADEHRREIPESGPWHYVNVPITEDRYQERFCPDGNCVVARIGHFKAIVADAKRPRTERQQALRFLIHFVEDMHQPLHVGDRRDRGGNDLQVQFFGQASNLHRVWDSGLIERLDADEVAWVEKLKALAARPDASTWERGAVTDWATESLQAARKAYQAPVGAGELKPGARLDQAYLDAHAATVQLRLAQSGVRLAAVLNAIWPGQAEGRPVGGEAGPR